ncbi:MAG: nuclear transport factor 2 family protein [bacterium]|nr:nuclear transport factor 2 family protein [bacterium]
MNRLTVMLLVLVGSLTLSGVAVAEEAISTDSVAVTQAAEALLEAYNAGDAKMFSGFFVAESSVFGPDGGPRYGQSPVQVAAEFEAAKYDLKWRHLEVKVYGSSAVTTGYCAGRVRLPDGTMQSVTWRTSLVWVKQGNGWKVAHNHVSALFPDLQDKSS